MSGHPSTGQAVAVLVGSACPMHATVDPEIVAAVQGRYGRVMDRRQALSWAGPPLHDDHALFVRYARPAETSAGLVRGGWYRADEVFPIDEPGAATTGTQHALRASQRALAASEGQNGTTEPCGAQMLVLEGYPSQDQQDLLGPNRGSRRWGVAGERAAVQQTTATEARRQGIRPVQPPARVTYTFVVPDRGRRDWDNYALICKPVQDGLVKAEILAGDHYAVLDAAVRFRVEEGRRALEIRLEPAAPLPSAGREDAVSDITPHEQRVIARAEAALRSNAEAYRLVEEAIEQRARAERAEARVAALEGAGDYMAEMIEDSLVNLAEWEYSPKEGALEAWRSLRGAGE